MHQCIRPWVERVSVRAIMEISALAISLADRPQRAIRVTSTRRRREDRSSISLLILSQTSAGKRTVAARAPYHAWNDQAA